MYHFLGDPSTGVKVILLTELNSVKNKKILTKMDDMIVIIFIILQPTRKKEEVLKSIVFF